MRPRDAVGGNERGRVAGDKLSQTSAEAHALLDRILGEPATTDRRYFQKAYWGLIELSDRDPDFLFDRNRRRFDYAPLRKAINAGVNLPEFGHFLKHWRLARQGSVQALAWVEAYLERADVQAAIREAREPPQPSRTPQGAAAGNDVRPARDKAEPPKSRTRTGG